MDEPCEAPEPSALNALKALLAGVDGEDAPSCDKRRAALVSIRKSFESASCPRAWCEEALAADVMSDVVSALISSKNKEVSITPPCEDAESMHRVHTSCISMQVFGGVYIVSIG